MTGNAPAAVPARLRGFTLIEVMVVVVIIGLLVTFAVISLGDNAARKLDEEASRFASLLRLAADEAILQGREIGLQIDDTSYAFFSFDDQFRTWTPMAGDVVFRQREMTDNIRLELFMDDLEMELQTAEPEDGEENTITPQILLLSSGEMTPFDLAFEFEEIEGRVVLRAYPNGAVEILGEDEF